MKAVLINICPNTDGYTVLFAEEKLVIQGDDYHDDIQAWTQGFVEGLKYHSEVEVVTYDFYYDNSNERDQWYDTKYTADSGMNVERYIEHITDQGFYLKDGLGEDTEADVPEREREIGGLLALLHRSYNWIVGK